MKDPKEIFLFVHNGHVNTMTPYIIEYGKMGENSVYEFSRGKNLFSDDVLFGVSVISWGGAFWTNDKEKSKAFSSIEEAREYISSLDGKPQYYQKTY